MAVRRASTSQKPGATKHRHLFVSIIAKWKNGDIEKFSIESSIAALASLLAGVISAVVSTGDLVRTTKLHLASFVVGVAIAIALLTVILTIVLVLRTGRKQRYILRQVKWAYLHALNASEFNPEAEERAGARR